MHDVATNAKVMEALIDRLNNVAARVASSNALRARHVKLTSILAADPRYGQDYTSLWANELHPTEDGYGLLAEQFVKMLQGMGIGPKTS